MNAPSTPPIPIKRGALSAARRRSHVYRRLRRAAQTLLALGLLLSCGGGGGDALAQEQPAPSDWPSLEDLSPRQRVAQLAVVAYYARPDDPEGDVRRLIVEEGIGGIVLQKGNGIFRNERGADLPTQIATLTADLQRMAIEEGPGVPLFVAIDHEGDGNPFTHLREGFTALPSPMAIGATWDPLAAEAVGRVAGAELEAVGINMLLGPGLDVLAEPRIDSGGDIGIRSFGGSPYWVARLGAAYIRGVHEGGRRRVLTVAKHFPGHGGSDRNPDSGVSTVIAPVNALETVDLAPFAAVTTEGPGDPDRPSITDALMTSHIRYFGLQGNLQDGTPPISFDREGLELLLEQGSFGFAAWRERGGLIVSDSLGVPAVRDWFAPRQDRFPNRLIARTALMAGNDVLLLAQFDAVGAWDLQLRNIVDTLDYFTEEYQRDSGFRARVDEAAARVLAQKQLLYPSLSLETVAVRPDRAAAAVGGAEARRTVDQVSARAVTAWQSADSPPARGDRIVVITPRYRDSQTDRLLELESPLACRDESCGLAEAEWQRLQGLGPTLVEAMILDQFGPAGLGLIDVGDLSSIAFCQLRQALSPVLSAPPSADAAEAATAEPAETAADRRLPPGVCDPDLDTQALVSQLAGADWIVFAFADLDPDESLRLRGLLLPQVQSLAREQGAHVAVLSFGPPYYIDTTNSAQLHAHYAAYTKIPSAVRAAVRAWFGAGEAPGASPVTVKNADYLLAQVLEPRPGPGLELQRVGEPPRELPARVTLSVTGLLDHNGHPVPDGTLVRITSEPAAALVGGTAELVSAGGEARGEVELVAGGTIRLRAETSSGAREVETLIVDLPVPSPTASIDTSTSPPAIAAALDGSGDDGEPGQPPQSPDLGLALTAVVLVGIAAALGPWRRKRRALRLRAALWAAAGGLGTYIGYAALVLRPGLRPSGIPPAVDSAICALLGASIALALFAQLGGLRGPESTSGRSQA